MIIREYHKIPHILSEMEQKHKTEKQEAEEQLFKKLLEESPEGILVYIEPKDYHFAKIKENPIVVRLIDGKIVYTYFPVPSFKFESNEQLNELVNKIFPNP